MSKKAAAGEGRTFRLWHQADRGLNPSSATCHSGKSQHLQASVSSPAKGG